MYFYVEDTRLDLPESAGLGTWGYSLWSLPVYIDKSGVTQMVLLALCGSLRQVPRPRQRPSGVATLGRS